MGPGAASAALQLRRRRGWMREASSPRAPAPLLELRSQAAKTTQVSESAARNKRIGWAQGRARARAYPRSGGRWRTWASSARLMASSPCSARFRIWLLRGFVLGGEAASRRRAWTPCVSRWRDETRAMRMGRVKRAGRTIRRLAQCRSGPAARSNPAYTF